MDFFSFKDQITKRPIEGQGKPSAREALSVTQLTAQIESSLRKSFPSSVLVKGEVSNLHAHRTSGHLYFSLKDAQACLECVMYRSEASRLAFSPEDGMELLATGRVAVYAPRGRYQLTVSRLEPVGRGALELALRQLHAKLAAEGLFAPERKKPLPQFPQRIAIVTSTQTAALQDMLKVLRRFGWLKLMIYHVPVQGEGAAARIAEALREISQQAQTLGGVDVILLGRGGGSLEDLWEFNQESVARAIVASRIPVVTGIGHEIDVSIADLVADYHAHTPTEAAQVVTANWRSARDGLDVSAVRLRREMARLVQEARSRLAVIERHAIFRRPMERINTARQLLDDRQRALALATGNRLRSARERMARLITSLSERHPRHRLDLGRERLTGLSRQLRGAIGRNHQRLCERVEALRTHLNAIGPEQVLRRGYSITMMKKTGAVVRSAQKVKEGDRLVTRFADGTVDSTVQDRRQMSLFE